MPGKVLIVEDEPIVALDLQQELEDFGCEIVALAQSADEALIAAEEYQPDLAMMDLHIVGSLDGIQTARLLREVYQVPSIFLTAYSDDATIARAVKEMPYGYLTKPFQTRELNASLHVALHKAKVDAEFRTSTGKMSASVDGMREGLLMVSASGHIQFMNASAERLIGCPLQEAAGHSVRDLIVLKSLRNRPVPLPEVDEDARAAEEFGLSLSQPGGVPILVDVAIEPVNNLAGLQTGYVLTLREANERVRSQVLDEAFNASDMFEMAPMAMVHLDGSGHIVRVNQALLNESGIGMEKLVGRTLTGLSMDPDPRIAESLMHKLLGGGTTITTTKSLYSN
jgi:PAS domain S-box-containing protein